MPWSLQTVGSTIYYIVNAAVPVVIAPNANTTATSIAVLGNGIVAYTSDINGLSWSTISVLPSVPASGLFMYKANGYWVCGGGAWNNLTESKVFKSTDLTSWTPCGTGNTIGGNYVIRGVAYGYEATNGYIWVAGGFPGTRLNWMTSTNFNNSTTTWNACSGTNANILLRTYCLFFEPTNKLWVAGGYGTTSIIWSIQPSNGSWSTAGPFDSSGGIAGQCNGLGYGNNLWVAVGSSGTAGGNTIATGTGTTSLTWTARGSSAISGVGNAVFYGKDDINVGLWVAVGQRTAAGGGGVIVYSYNPTVSWTLVSNANTIFTTACYGISFSGGKWIATGAGGNTIARSFDGKNWEGIGANNPTIGTGQNSVYGS